MMEKLHGEEIVILVLTEFHILRNYQDDVKHQFAFKQTDQLLVQQDIHFVRSR